MTTVQEREFVSINRKLQIQLPFPSEHPYYSHVARFAPFPSFDTPDDVRKGKLACQSKATLPETAPASAPDPNVMAKTKGHFARWEMIKPQNASERKPLNWPGHLYYQVSLRSFEKKLLSKSINILV